MIFISDLFLLAGCLFIFVASLGILRMPDIYTRIHAATKAGTLGTAMLLSGAAGYFLSLRSVLEMIIAVLFLLITAPVSYHLVGKAVYHQRGKLYPGTKQF